MAPVAPARVLDQIGPGADLIVPLANGEPVSALSNHHDLGIHTELISDGVMDLIEAGAVTGAAKDINRPRASRPDARRRRVGGRVSAESRQASIVLLQRPSSTGTKVPPGVEQRP
jgi:hypothetical protein